VLLEKQSEYLNYPVRLIINLDELFNGTIRTCFDAEKIFNNQIIPCEVDIVTVDFTGIRSVSVQFAKQYNKVKKNKSFPINEVNVCRNVSRLLYN